MTQNSAGIVVNMMPTTYKLLRDDCAGHQSCSEHCGRMCRWSMPAAPVRVSLQQRLPGSSQGFWSLHSSPHVRQSSTPVELALTESMSLHLTQPSAVITHRPRSLMPSHV